MASADNQVTGNGLYLTNRGHLLNSGEEYLRDCYNGAQAGQRIQLALLTKATLGHARCQDSFGVSKPPD